MQRFALLLAAALLLPACAARQRVPLDCVPRELTVYVDQRPLEGQRDGVELRVDRPHQILIKGEGFVPVFAVLEPVETPDGPRLELSLDDAARFAAEDLCTRVTFEPMRRDLEVRPETP